MNGELHDLLPESDDPITKEYIQLIKRGLPKTNNPKKIAIVGAGMAGFVSAQLLVEMPKSMAVPRTIPETRPMMFPAIISLPNCPCTFGTGPATKTRSAAVAMTSSRPSPLRRGRRLGC